MPLIEYDDDDLGDIEQAIEAGAQALMNARKQGGDPLRAGQARDDARIVIEAALNATPECIITRETHEDRLSLAIWENDAGDDL